MSDKSVSKGFSLVIPFYNEAENVSFVLSEAREALPDAEVIAVDDGSSDPTWDEILKFEDVRAVRFVENRGQSAAVYYGLQIATGPICGMMDGDGQNVPASFVPMLERIRQGADVVCGYRQKRQDTWSRRIASKVANHIRRSILSDGIRDTGCSQKIFWKSSVEALTPFNGLHRYLPAIFLNEGLRIEETPVDHRSRNAGDSKYTNWKRALVGIYDLIGVRWLLSRRKSPPPIAEAIHNGRRLVSK